MKTTIIYGQNHKGSTYHIARMLAEKIGGDITEFFLPRDFGEFCIGCSNCFEKSESLCPHHEKLQNITNAISEADVIILASPVYVYHASGPMKTLLDHYGYRWMVHRPDPSMFSKQGICISTAAGSGTKSTNKDMADSMFFWGIPKIYKYGVNVAAVNWNGVSEKNKAKIERHTDKISSSVKKRLNNVHTGIRTKILFMLMRTMQKKIGLCKSDRNYWNSKGWLKKNRPWKSD